MTDAGRAPQLSGEERSRYARHITLPEVGVEGQQRLKAASVLCIGAGGLGYANGDTIAIAGTSIGMGAGTTANDLSFTERSFMPSRGFLISLIPCFKVFSVLNTAHLVCIVFCIEDLRSDAFVLPFELRILSNLSRHLSVSL